MALVGVEHASVASVFQATAKRRGDAVAMRTRDDSLVLTWNDYAREVRDVAAGLAALGVERGSTVATMMSNRPEFQVVDAATMHLGAVAWSIYGTYPVEQIVHLLRDAGTNVVVTEQAKLDVVCAAAAEAGAEHVVVVDGEAPEGGLTLEQVKERAQPGFDLDAAWRAIGSDDLLTIIYTSGTTGPPKGVQLTHGNIVAAIRSFADTWNLPDEGRFVSWLPMAHIAERLVTLYAPMFLGSHVTTCADPRAIQQVLPEVRPSYFFGVPRIWEKLKAAGDLTGERDPAKLRERLGLDHLVLGATGAAPCPPEVITWFHDIGIKLAEVYGMSEASGVGTHNRPADIRIGSVGPPMLDMEVSIASDGEVLMRGPHIMAGYRNQPDATAEAIDADGWLHSGDIGRLDDDGFLHVVDRKKELIINAAGKNMSPANIEAALKTSSPLVDQAIAVGDRRPYNVALVTLETDAARQATNRPDATTAELAADPAVIAEVARGVGRANQRLARVEQIKRFALLPNDWEPGGDELTPTSKLKRRPIAGKYAPQIDALYADGGIEPLEETHQ